MDVSASRPLLPISSLAEAGLEPELTALAQLYGAGLKVAPLRVVTPAAEEAFYRLNNLPTQLLACFAGLDLSDPDEDDLEERAPQAQALLKTHYLLDEFVDSFYASLAGLPERVWVRRALEPGAAPVSKRLPGEHLPGLGALRGRPTLLALKDLWVRDWSFEALLARTAQTGSVALSARSVILSAPDAEPGGVVLSARAAEILGRPVELWQEPTGAITGVQL